MKKPRDYQKDIIDAVREAFRAGHKRVLIVAATGSGKSVIIGCIIFGLASNGKTVYIIAHRSRLIRQLYSTINAFGVLVSMIKGASKVRYTTRLGLVETIRRRLDKLKTPDYLMIDEAHHSLSTQYLEILNKWSDARVIGLTATPERTDGKGMGEVYSIMIEGPSMRWLIENNYLARYRYYEVPHYIDLSQVKKDAKTGDYKEKDLARAIRTAHLAGDAIESYNKYMPNQTGIVFCVGIPHAVEVAESFTLAGIPCKPIDGTMSEAEQDALISQLETGEVKLLASADLIGEGVDIPSINGVIQLRLTDSIVIFLQQCGRALRLKKDGSSAVIIDHVQNRKAHGLPCDPRSWSLEGNSKRKKEVCTRTCSECARVFADGNVVEQAQGCPRSTCPILEGKPPTVTETVVNVIKADLVEVENPWLWAGGIDPVLASGPEYTALLEKADNEEKLRMIQRARGHKPRWIQHMLIAKGLKVAGRSFSKYTKG